MRDELDSKADTQSVDSLRQEIDDLQTRERAAVPEPGYMKNVSTYLRGKQSMFDRQVIMRYSSNDWYENVKRRSFISLFFR